MKDLLNKSYDRFIVYKEEIIGRKILHFSIDDTIECFKDILKNDYASIFQNSTLSWLKKLHEKYGLVISCFVYYEEKEFNLKMFLDKYRAEFLSNSDWLRFGFHAYNAKSTYVTSDINDDYVNTIAELKRIVGSDSIDNVLRIHYYGGSYNNIVKTIRIRK